MQSTHHRFPVVFLLFGLCLTWFVLSFVGACSTPTVGSENSTETSSPTPDSGTHSENGIEPNTPDVSPSEPAPEPSPEPNPEPAPAEEVSTPEPSPEKRAEPVVPEKPAVPEQSGGDGPVLCPKVQTTAVPKQLGLDPFYQQYFNSGGIPIIASGKVPKEAFAQAHYVLANMLKGQDCIRKAIALSGIRIGILARSEVTTHLPEYKDLNKAFPGTDWDKRARGLGATLVRPLTSGATENLLAERSDRWFGESIFLHEFAHSFFEFGIRSVKGGLQKDADLRKLYADAMKAGLWKRTYAATNAAEYWAETVQSWFNNNLEANPPNGVHGPVNTRKELETYDPKMAKFIAGFFDPKPWPAYCSYKGSGQTWIDPTPKDPMAAKCEFDRVFLKNIGCDKEKNVPKPESKTKGTLIIVNRTYNEQYTSWWINSQGKRVRYGTIAPRRQWSISSFYTHSWVVTNKAGKCVGLYTLTNPENVVAYE